MVMQAATSIGWIVLQSLALGPVSDVCFGSLADIFGIVGECPLYPRKQT